MDKVRHLGPKSTSQSSVEPCIYLRNIRNLKFLVANCRWLDIFPCIYVKYFSNLFISNMSYAFGTNKHKLQYIPRNMHTVFALLCIVVVKHWLICPYPSGLLRWHCGYLTIVPVPAKQTWWIWINNSCEFIMNDCITTTKQSTTKPCAYFLGYTVN